MKIINYHIEPRETLVTAGKKNEKRGTTDKKTILGVVQSHSKVICATTRGHLNSLACVRLKGKQEHNNQVLVRVRDM